MYRKEKILFYFILFYVQCCFSQSETALMDFIAQRKNSFSKKPSIEQTYQVISNSKSITKPFFVFYKSFLSEQFAANCAFGPSCSQFAVAIIKEKGFLKGYLLTLDRLTRCHGHVDSQNSILNLNTEYDIYNDTPDMY